MTKELRTADQLSDMIVSSLGVDEIEIQVRRDHAYVWQPTVVATPGDLIGYQGELKKSQIGCALRSPFGTDGGTHPRGCWPLSIQSLG